MNSNTNKPSRAVPFILGLVLGILAVVFLPGYVRPYIPDWAAGKTTVVKGTVTAKQKKDTALLLTVNTPDGVLLATFTRKVDEINLLVNEKDTLEFTLAKYTPFIDDPKIIRVLKEQQAAPAAAPEARPEEKTAKPANARPKEEKNRQEAANSKQ